MGGKHLKKLRAEKSKIHLKKKKLPKGKNVTDTTFKVKKILTLEQLKRVDKNEPVSKWNVPLKDLLIRLNHYNMTSRLNALYGIKELLTNYSEILQGPSLKSLISRLLDLLTDEEHKIRKTVVDVLSYMLNLISSSAIIPFYGILNVHLGCAMTHRDPFVQQDSIKFIDVLIKHAPETLKHNFWAIAQNFIRILKKFLNESHRMSSKGSKPDLEKFKTEMFNRFYLFVAAGFPDASMEKQFFSANIDFSVVNREVIFLRQSNNQYKKIPDLSLLFLNSKNKKEALSEGTYDEFQLICSPLMSLLFDTWAEFCPDQKFNGRAFECMLTEGIAALLCVLLKTIMFLYEKAQVLGVQMERWFAQAYGLKFNKCFTSKFPFLMLSSGKKQSSSKFNESGSPCSDCVLQNLIICYLSYSFKFPSENREVEKTMENYISWELTKKNSTEIDILSKVINAVINTPKSENSKGILRNVVIAFGATRSPELRQELSKALMKVVLDGHESVWREEQSVVNWMRSLPEYICRTEFSEEVIETLLMLVKRPAGAEIVKEVELKANAIINNMESFKPEGQKMIVNILYRCNCKVLEELLREDIFSNQSFSQSLKDYLKNIFCYKLSTQSTLCK